jgi:RNA polymerase sigma-70 factor (ECF subfamily)
LQEDREQEWRRQFMAARAGDEAAYRGFLGSVATCLRAWARRALTRAGRSPAEAEDIVQETLIALHTRRHTWDAAQAVTPWVHGIARHKLIDALRKRTGHDHLDIADLAEVLPGDAASPAALPAIDVARMIATLPERQARIVRGVFLEEKRAGELGQELAMSEGAVRVALHRALKQLGARFGLAAATEASATPGEAGREEEP